MGEKNLSNESKLSSRNTLFLKTTAIQTQEESEKSICSHVQEANTIQAINKKIGKIPFLNLAGNKQNTRSRVLSLGTKHQDRVETDRERIKDSDGCVSYFLHDVAFGLKHRKSDFIAKEINENSKKTSMFPPISNGQATPIEFFKSTECPENSTDMMRRKRSKGSIHCKVLLKKNTNFPFFGSNLHETKKADILKTKGEENAENFDLEDLNISRINELEEPASPGFISRESYKEIAIF